jgi:uncharacterized protein (TIGR03000 family)
MKRPSLGCLIALAIAGLLGLPLNNANAQRGGRGAGGGGRAIGGGGVIRGGSIGGARGGAIGGGGIYGARGGAFGAGGIYGNRYGGYGYPYGYGYNRGFGFGGFGYGGYGYGGYGGLGYGGFLYGGMWPAYYGGYLGDNAWPYYYSPYNRVWTGDFFGGYGYDYLPPDLGPYPPGLPIGGYVPSYPQPQGGYTPPLGPMPPNPNDFGGKPRVMTATVVIHLPVDSAELWFNGAKTSAQGLKREFTTPELTPGRLYSYEVRARWTQEGKQFDQTRKLQVQAGSQAILAFLPNDREVLPLPTPKQELPLPTPK